MVQQHGQDLVQQCLAPLSDGGPRGQIVAHLGPCLALTGGDGLVEQADDLVQYVGGRLREDRQQDRVAALGFSPVQ